MVILPGWGFDAAVFPLGRFPCNIIVPDSPLTGHVDDSLFQFLQHCGCGPVDVLGWSLGSICAARFASSHPELVGNLVLVSARSHYPEQELSGMMTAIMEDRTKALGRFYVMAFHGQKEDYRNFRKEHMERLSGAWDTKNLIKGLNFLTQQPINTSYFNNINDITISFIHGRHDIIAPIECMPVPGHLSSARVHILEDAGHVPFLKQEFHEIISNLS